MYTFIREQMLPGVLEYEVRLALPSCTHHMSVEGHGRRVANVPVNPQWLCSDLGF